MKAKRKSDGKIIEVRYLAITNIYVEYIDNADDTFKVTKAYHPSDLDFDVEEAEQTESDLRISVAKLREVLESHFAHRILPSEIDEIINEVKKEI